MLLLIFSYIAIRVTILVCKNVDAICPIRSATLNFTDLSV